MDFAVYVSRTESSIGSLRRRVPRIRLTVSSTGWENALDVDYIADLGRKKDAILERWFQSVAASYPAETSRFLGTQKNPFANPVGHTLRKGLKGLLECLMEGSELTRAVPHLDDIVRIRAVQDFSPSEAVSFLFSLKAILREPGGGAGDGSRPEHVAEMEGRIDDMALAAFDIYLSCRETLFNIKVREIKEQAAMEAGIRLRKAAGSGKRIEHRRTAGGPEMKRGESV